LSKASRPTANFILGRLTEKERERLRPHLQYVELQAETVLFQPGRTAEYVYFPEQAVVSVLAVTPDGQCTEVGLIGVEGLTPVCVAMGAESTVHQHLVQLPSAAWRVSRAAIQEEFAHAGTIQKVSLAFACLMFAQISQTALCNRMHGLEQRLARWLLMCHDRATGDELSLTHEFISVMLGTSRVAVTQTQRAAQDAGLIEYKRGRIRILDRQQLEAAACPCYDVIRHEFDRYLSVN
jgi:CRP-like cAMP-binding protein